MLFNSYSFLLFFIVVTFLYYVLPYKVRWILLLIASCYFYMQFVPIYILILFGTIIVDYIAGIMIENAEDNERRQKLFLTLSVLANVGVLCVFKYYNFFIENINAAGANLKFLSILLPIGLSFHTFQAMAYTFEVYRGNQKAERHFGIYSLYVMFYPQLVAGPIEKPQSILHQFKSKIKFNPQMFYSGIRLMIWGLFKKVVVADRLSLYTDVLYADQNPHTHYLNIFLAFLFFIIQVYCDFSGYSDIALGCARTMGIDLMVNFNRPFFSKSITEYWRRWHISLSAWFNDYLFTPMATTWYRSMAKFGILLAIFVTFTISGLWHGAAWTFVVFGMVHGIAIIIEQVTKRQRGYLQENVPKPLFNVIAIMITFTFVLISVVFFRANTMDQAFSMLHDLFTLRRDVPFTTIVRHGSLEFGVSSLILSVVSIAWMLFVEIKYEPLLLKFNKQPKLDILMMSITLVMIIVLGVFQRNSFIYFQF